MQEGMSGDHPSRAGRFLPCSDPDFHSIRFLSYEGAAVSIPKIIRHGLRGWFACGASSPQETVPAFS